MSVSMAQVSLTIYNERTKLLANALDRASTALGVGGGLSVLGQFNADHEALADPTNALPYMWLTATFGFCSIMLHLVASNVLTRLR
jgi:hypothetical protein